MRARLVLWSSAMISVSIFGLLYCAKDSPTSAQPGDYTGTISGVVTDRHSRPIQGVLVSANADSATPCVSDAHGRFTIGKVDRGTHRLTFTQADYETDSILSVQVHAAGEDVELPDTVKLSCRWYVLKGRIVSGGNPVPFAGVIIADQPYSMLTDNNGAYKFDRIPKTASMKILSAKTGVGYGSLYPLIGVVDDTTRIPDIRIDDKGGTVSGTVFDTLDRPVSNVPLEAMGGGLRDTAGSDGTFSLANVPANEPSVSITVPALPSGLTGGVAGLMVDDGAEISGIAIYLRPATSFVHGMKVEMGDVMVVDTATYFSMTVLGISQGTTRIAGYEWFFGAASTPDTATTLPRVRSATSALTARFGDTIHAAVRTVNDSGQYSDKCAFTIRVVNSKPVVSVGVAADTNAAAGDTVRLQAHAYAYFTGTATDPIGGIDTIQWNFGDGTTWISHDNGVSVGHLYDSAGTFKAIVRVEDVEGNVIRDTVIVMVTAPTIGAPVCLRPVNNDTAHTGADSVTLVWSKVPGTGVRYSVYFDYLVTKPAAILDSNLVDTSLSVKVVSGRHYYWQVKVSTASAWNVSAVNNFVARIDSAAVNLPPVISSRVADMRDSAVVGNQYADTVHASDPEHGLLTFALTQKPQGMVITDSIVTWTPQPADTGAKSVTVRVADPQDSAATLTWTIHVTRVVDLPPVISSRVQDMTAAGAVGKLYRDTVHADDPEHGALTFALTQKPQGMTMTDSIVTWTPDTNQSGNQAVTVSVSDGAASSALSWTIAVVRAPLVTRNPSSVTVVAGQSFTLTVGASGDSLKYQWQKDGGSIANETDSTYHKVQALTTHAGLYRCIVYNSLGADTSDTARVTVNPAVTPIVYVKADAAAGGDGSTWAKALRGFQEGINKATNGTQVWVAKGVYIPDTTGKGRAASFQMKAGVGIFGGFAGTETALTQRNWRTDTTTLSGDIGIPGDNTDNCYHVIYNPSTALLGSNSVLDGFVVTGGRADVFGNVDGAGMYNEPMSIPSVRNCVFTNNHASQYGGAIYCGSMANDSIDSCSFSLNSAQYGGAIFVSLAHPVVRYSVFSANSSGGHMGGSPDYGGAFFGGGSNARFLQCRFESNTSSSGGAAYFSDGGEPTFTDCAFLNNSNGAIGTRSRVRVLGCFFANNSGNSGGSTSCIELNDMGGGGGYSAGGVIVNSTFTNNSGAYTIYAGTQSTAIVNCSIVANQGTSTGGVYAVVNYGRCSIINTLLWNNYCTSGSNDDIMYSVTQSLDSSVTIRNSIIKQSFPAGQHVSGQDPSLIAVADNGGPTQTLALNTGSPALDFGLYVYTDSNDSLFVDSDGGTSYFDLFGTPFTPSGTVTRLNATDARGVRRPQGTGIDLGAFELEQ